MTIEIKNLFLGFESEDIDTLRDSILDGAAAAVECIAVSDEVKRLFDYTTGLESLAMTLSHYQSPKATDLALTEIALEMMDVGSDIDTSDIRIGLENYTDSTVSLEGVMDKIKAAAKKMGALLKKLWLGFKRMLGSLNSWIKLEVIQLKELRTTLSKLKDTDVEVDLSDLSLILTSGKARSFADLVKACEKQCDTMIKNTDVYSTFLGKYAAAGYSSWKNKGGFKERLVMMTDALTTVIQETKQFLPVKLDANEGFAFFEPTFKQSLGLNTPATLSKIAAVENPTTDYREIADAIAKFGAEAVKVDLEYTEPTPLALPRIAEVSKLVDKLISFSENWYRVQDQKTDQFDRVMTEWINKIELYDNMGTDDSPNAGAQVRNIMELIVRDYGLINQIAYGTWELFEPFYHYADRGLHTTRNVRRTLEKMTKKYDKA